MEGRKARAHGVDVLVGGLALATVGAVAARLHWLLELASHLRLHLLWSSCALLLLALGLRRRGAALVAALCLVAHGWPIGQLWLPPAAAAPVAAPAAAPLRILSFNVLTENREVGAIRRFVETAEADVTFLFEVSRELHRELQALPDDMVVVLSEPRSDNFGLAVVAHRRMVEARLVDSGDPAIAFAEVHLEHGDQRWSLLGVHPLPPVTGDHAARRDRSLAHVAAWASAQTGPHVVVGDLNATPFSPRFDDLLAAGGLRNSQVGYGYAGTWPAGLPRPLRIPIDHALVSADVAVHGRRVGPPLGSDHAPIIVEVAATGSALRTSSRSLEPALDPG